MEQLTLNLQEVKQEIRERLNQTAENFVFIGYRLRQVLDAGAYAQEGHSDIYAFARSEFSLEKSVVSRFMKINEKYSVGGYGPELREEFKGYGSSKLSEMLSLSDAECGMITEDTTIKQIREYKDFKKDESKEITGQQSFARNETEDHELLPLLKDYFSKHMDLLRKILFNNLSAEDMYEEMNLTGTGTYKHKFVFLMMHSLNDGVSYKVFGRQQPVKLSWEELHSLIRELMAGEYDEMAAEEKERLEREKTEREEKQEAEEQKKREEQEKIKEKREKIRQEEKPEKNKQAAGQETEIKPNVQGKAEQAGQKAAERAEPEGQKAAERAEGEQEITDQCDVATIHELKIAPEYFDLIVSGIKKFEIRKNDRNFEVGDILRLKEYDGDYTGQETDKEIAYIFQSPGYGLEDGYCIMNW